MAERRRITVAVTGAGGTRVARYVLSALVAEFTTRLLGFIGLDRSDCRVHSGGDSPARRDRPNLA